MRLQRILLLGLVSVCGLSLPLQATAADTQPPSVPTGLVVLSFSPSILQARWNPSTDNVGVVGYRLDVATDSSFSAPVATYTNKDVGAVTVVRLLGLSPATTYYIRVRAYDAAGNTSANSATGDARTKSLPSYPVADWVKTGSLHWSRAKGDPRTDDSNDFDDSMGDHHCTMSRVNTYLVDPEDVALQFTPDDVQCDFSTPTAGDYWLAALMQLSKNVPIHVQTCAGGGVNCTPWVDAPTPDASSDFLTSQFGFNYDWTVTIPQGQTTTRFRFMLPQGGPGGTRTMNWLLLTHKVANVAEWFSALPMSGTHPRLMFTASELAALRTAVLQPGKRNYLYSRLPAMTSCPLHGNVSGGWTSLNHDGGHDFSRYLLGSALTAALYNGSGFYACPNGPTITGQQMIDDAIHLMQNATDWPKRCIGGPESICSNNATLWCRQEWTTNQASCMSGGGICSPGQYQFCTADSQCPISRCGSRFLLANELDISMYTSALALAYDMLFNYMTPAQRTTFAQMLAEEASLSEDAIHSGSNLVSIDSRGVNKRPHVANALGLVGLVLDNFLATDYVPTATDSMLINLDTSGDPLGGWGEPLGYYTFGQERFTEFASALRRNGGVDLYQYHSGAFGKTANWLADMMSGDHLTAFPGGDSTRVAPVFAWSLMPLINEYRSGIASWLFNRLYPDNASLETNVVLNYRSRALFQTLLWLNESVAPTNPDSVLPTTHIYDVPMTESPGYTPGNSGYVFMRTSFGSPDALYLATQAGDNQGDHGHQDAGSLYLQAYGQTLLDDFAKQGDYGSASQVWHAGGLGHDSVLIDSKGVANDTSNYVNLGSVTSHIEPSFASLASMDLTNAYSYQNWNPVLGAKRHALMVKTGTDRGYFVVIDDVNKDNSSHTYGLHYLGDSTVTWSNVSANRYRLVGAKGGMDVFVAEPPNTTFNLLTQPCPGCEAANYLEINTTQAHGYFVNLLFPTSSRLGITSPVVTTVRDVAISGFQLNGDTILFNRAGGLQSAANVQSDGELLFVRGSASAQAFLATKATRLSYQGIQYLSAPQAPTAVAVEYTPSGLRAELDMGTASSLTLTLAAAPQQVTFNGQSVPFTYAAGQLTITTLVGRGTLTTGATGSIPGDLDGNGTVDVLDLQRMVNCLLGLETDASVLARADLDGVGGPTILDLQRLVNLLLGV